MGHTGGRNSGGMLMAFETAKLAGWNDGLVPGAICILTDSI